MGSSHTVDEDISIYVEINKPYYVAGEYVEGFIVLKANKPKDYQNLTLRVLGEQYVRWSEGSGKNRRTYSNKYESYNSHFIIANYSGKVNTGAYSFPFAFLLPAMMSGSYFSSNQCYIKYTVRAELTHIEGPKKTQFYEVFLNIIEPPRMPFAPISKFDSVDSKCCQCCCSYGIIAVTLNCSANFVRNGDTITISGQIDNSQGTQNILSSKVLFQNKRILISSGGHCRNPIDSSFDLGSIGPVRKAQNKQFNFSAKIPSQISDYTAIGRVTARYFTLRVDLEYGCCANKAEGALHLIVHSTTPKLMNNTRVPPPQNWSPQTFPKVLCEAMKPYMYSPMAQIPYQNMITDQIVNPNQNNMGNFYGQENSMIEQQIYNNYHPVFYNEKQIKFQHQGYQPYFENSSEAMNQNTESPQFKPNPSKNNTQAQLYRNL